MISAIVLAKNEEKNISECLKSLSWCDEIIVIDDYSEDKTAEIAEKLGATVFVRRLANDFSEQRNFGIEKARGDWILFVDADERVSQELRDEIKLRSNMSKDLVSGFLIKRRDVMWGRELKHGETSKGRFLRLAKKGAGKWKRQVHETWEVKGVVGELANHLVHYPHQTVTEFLAEVDRYSTLHAQSLAKEGKRSSFLKILIWPKLKFVQNWIFRLGFLDGTPGFVVAILMSFHSYLAWSKLWLRQNKKQRT